MTNRILRQLFSLLLPSVLVLVLYWAFFSEHKLLREAQAKRETARIRTAAPEEIARQEATLKNINATLSAQAQESDALRSRWLKLTQMTAPVTPARSNVLRNLSQLLWRRGLYAVEETPTDGEAGKLPPSLDEVFKRLGSNQSSSPRLWKIRFYGRYNDVLGTLEELEQLQAGAELPIFPVSITMSPTRLETDWRSWTLLVWI